MRSLTSIPQKMHADRDSPAHSIRAPGEDCFVTLNILEWTAVGVAVRCREIMSFFLAAIYVQCQNIGAYEINGTLSWTILMSMNAEIT